MRTQDLLNHNIPRLQPADSIGKARQLMNDFKATHLPVVSDEKYLGLISEEDLLDLEEDKVPIEALQNKLMPVAVAEDTHFLQALNRIISLDSNVIPVVSKTGYYLGAITGNDLLKSLAAFTGSELPGGMLVLQMEQNQYHLSEITRLVESNDCTILHLNTQILPENGQMQVTLHLNKQEIAHVVATLERYDYQVLYYFGIEHFENEIETNYRNLMNYLDI